MNVKNEAHAYDIAVRHVAAVDGVVKALAGLSDGERRAVLLEVRARLDLNSIVPPPVRDSGQRVATGLQQKVLALLDGAPRGGFTAGEVQTRAKAEGMNESSVSVALSILSTSGEILRTGERGSYKYSLKP